ncbi:MAG: S4 domain-containing protein [Azoarcus sp.]|nr:S4 domain-containing protein [Azoarcus sp.]PKO57486.1 MAG: RNA-binding protein [Betaproteobacteria bacterium HGW-Betaproteobacteria-19]
MRSPAPPDNESTRLDKWLWAARFYKHRSGATEAVDGGKVKLNGLAVKPARSVKPGDQIEITVADTHISVVVRGIAEKRGPAKVAQELYEESAESIARREAAQELRRFAATPGADLHGRPTKRDRRLIQRLKHD